MKELILLFIMAVTMTISAFSQQRAIPLRTHEGDYSKELSEKDRDPINLPISVYYDSDTNILEVWCADDNIQAEVYVYDESGNVEAYSACMNVTIQLTPSPTHTIILIGDKCI